MGGTTQRTHTGLDAACGMGYDVFIIEDAGNLPYA
jgi:hypothetical protein